MNAIHHLDGDPYNNDPKNLKVVDVTMNRNPDCETSIAAASTVSRRKPTLRMRVTDFALDKPQGFIDEELAVIDPTGPESSVRKRRSELTDDAMILPVPGETRRNSKGQDCQLWLHRIYFINPPPIKAREVKPSRFAALQEENARLRAEIDEARQPERIAIVAFLRRCEKAIDEQRVKYEESGNQRTARLLLQEKDAYANAAGMIERGEHRR